MSARHMRKTNGNPNRFFGWGGEDGVMYVRILKAGLKRTEVPRNCTFEAEKHDHDEGNEERSHYKRLVTLVDKKVLKFLMAF